MKRKVMLLITALSLAGLVAAGATLAYFTSSDTATNVVTTGNVKIEIHETTNENPEDYVYVPDKGIVYTKPYVPGSVISKIPIIKNTGSNSAYVRARIVFLDDNNNEVSFGDHQKPEIDIQNAWLSTDGIYYYYSSVLAPGEETSPLFTAVSIPTSWGNDMADFKFNVVVKAEAVQSDNTGDDVMAAFSGVEIETSAGDIDNDGSNDGNNINNSNGINGGNGIQNGENTILPPAAEAEIPDDLVPRAQYYVSKYLEIVSNYENANPKTNELKTQAIDQIKELLEIEKLTTLNPSNDQFRAKLVSDYTTFPTVSEEGLADELGFTKEEASSYYLNAYVSPHDKYLVIPYISQSPNNSGQKWNAYYIQLNGQWYEPKGSDTAAKRLSSSISGLFQGGLDSIKDNWVPIQN